MKFMILVLLALLVASGMAVGMTEKEEGYIAGIENGYELGYRAHSGLGNATAAQQFNVLTAKYNSYLDRIGGQQYKLAAMPLPDNSWQPEFLRNVQGTDPWAGIDAAHPANLQTPVLQANNTSPNGIVHAIDGGTTNGPQYTTNDINALPNSAIENYQTVGDVDPATGKRINGDGYLGGV